MFCSNCGANCASYKFCPACGTQIPVGVANVVTPPEDDNFALALRLSMAESKHDDGIPSRNHSVDSDFEFAKRVAQSESLHEAAGLNSAAAEPFGRSDSDVARALSLQDVADSKRRRSELEAQEKRDVELALKFDQEGMKQEKEEEEKQIVDIFRRSDSEIAEDFQNEELAAMASLQLGRQQQQQQQQHQQQQQQQQQLTLIRCYCHERELESGRVTPNKTAGYS